MDVKAPCALIAEAPTNCWKCQAEILVRAVVLPHDAASLIEASSESGDVIEDLDPLAYEEGASMPTYITAIDPALLKLLGSHYKFAESKTAGLHYYANHCAGCGAIQGDHYLKKPDGPFWPMGDSLVTMTLLSQPLAISAESFGNVLFPLGEFDVRFEGEEKLRLEAEAAARLARRADRKKNSKQLKR